MSVCCVCSFCFCFLVISVTHIARLQFSAIWSSLPCNDTISPTCLHVTLLHWPSFRQNDKNKKKANKFTAGRTKKGKNLSLFFLLPHFNWCIRCWCLMNWRWAIDRLLAHGDNDDATESGKHFSVVREKNVKIEKILMRKNVKNGKTESMRRRNWKWFDQFKWRVWIEVLYEHVCRNGYVFLAAPSHLMNRNRSNPNFFFQWFLSLRALMCILFAYFSFLPYSPFLFLPLFYFHLKIFTNWE